MNRMGHLRDHFTVWAIIGTSKIASMTVHEWNAVASIFALVCGGIGSLCFAYYQIYKARNNK